MTERAVAAVNVAAIERNVARLRRAAGSALMCAVVKGDGYGHGALAAARAAQAAGAPWLAVATAGEAAELREAGIAGPVLVMGALTASELSVALAAAADVVAWTPEIVDLALKRAGRPVRFHVKLDSGMGRLGTRDTAEARAVAEQIVAAGPRAELVGVMTHFATADGDLEFAAQQLERFTAFADTLRERDPRILVHAANSAATLRLAAARLDMVRCGIAIYGLDPLNRDPGDWELEPALELTSYLAAVKPIAAGESAGYGRRFIASAPTVIGTAPIGYADGVRRGLGPDGPVLVGGERRPLAGTVSMDNITIDLGPDTTARVGDPVTIIGRQREGVISAEEFAERIGTINYEVTCGIGPRVPRHLHRDGAPA